MKWLRLGLLVFALAISLLFTPKARADTSADITVTAQGFIVAAPGNFTLTYITDYEIGISWTKPAGAANTMVRAAFGHVPANISDGYQVYYGAGASATDTAVSLGTPEVVYYRAWSQTAGGLWGGLWASGDTSSFMSASFLFIGLIAIACFLTWLASRRPNILVAMASGMTWLALGFWILMGDVTNLGITSAWTQVLVWVFMIMAFVPFLLQMNVEIRREERGQRWTEFGKPKVTMPSSYELYKNELQRRTRRGRR